MSEQEIEGEGAVVAEPVEIDEEQDDIFPEVEVQRENTAKIIQKGLQKIGKVASGKNHAWTELHCEKKKILNLFGVLLDYSHLRVLNLNSNWISDFSSVASLKYLTNIDISNNRLATLDPFIQINTLQFLQVLNLAGNQLTHLSHIHTPNLLSLDLSRNQIVSCQEFNGHPTLKVLTLRKNKLVDLKGLTDMPNLEELYAAENPITTIADLSALPSLKKLHLRKTEVKILQGNVPDLPKLQYVSFREGKFDDIKQMSALKTLPELKTLNFLANEMAENTEYNFKEELIMLMPKLKRVNKENIEDEEVADALNKLKERIEEQEKQRLEEEEKRKEEEDRLRLEEEERIKNGGGAENENEEKEQNPEE